MIQNTKQNLFLLLSFTPSAAPDLQVHSVCCADIFKGFTDSQVTLVFNCSTHQYPPPVRVSPFLFIFTLCFIKRNTKFCNRETPPVRLESCKVNENRVREQNNLLLSAEPSILPTLYPLPLLTPYPYQSLTNHKPGSKQANKETQKQTNCLLDVWYLQYRR